jgi:hypothetical protein
MPTVSKASQILDFDHALNGVLYSLLSWKQLSEFWPKIDPAAGWYLYAVGETLPASAAHESQVKTFVREMDALLHRDHDEDYCGIVFANDLEHPSLVKIYDPHHLGSSCGSSKNPPLPGWIMSRMPPTEIRPQSAVPENRKRWWQTLLSGS